MRRISILIALTTWLGVPVARADLVVIVNPSSGVEKLSRNQAIDIFMGRYRELPSGLTALPIDIGRDSTERRRFYWLLTHKSLADVSSYWSRLVFSGKASPPFQARDAQTALDLVANNPNAIAYVDRASVDHRVRVVLDLAP